MDSSAQQEYCHRPKNVDDHDANVQETKNTICIMKPINVEIGGDSSSVITPFVAQQTGSRQLVMQLLWEAIIFSWWPYENASQDTSVEGLIPLPTGESSANSSQTRGLEFILIVPQEKPNASAIFELNLLAPEAQEKALAFPKFDLNVPAPEENDDDNAY
nr:hypothetical protein CFP56_06283 [Quercus suber]